MIHSSFFILMWKKFVFYLKRYGFAELIGGLLVLVISTATFYATNNKIVAAYAGTIGENIGFYGAIIIGDVLKSRKSEKNWNKKHLVLVLRNVLIEFGGAEILDSLIVRPGMLYLFTSLISSYEFGALVGVVAADILFYSLAVLSSELTKKFRK